MKKNRKPIGNRNKLLLDTKPKTLSIFKTLKEVGCNFSEDLMAIKTLLPRKKISV